MLNKLKKILYNPKVLVLYLLEKCILFRILNDSNFIKLEYLLKKGSKLNIKNPETFNEKLQWLKIYDRNPLYTKLVDKYEVRKYVSDKIGEKYLIPIIGVYNSIDDIPFQALPEKYVLKCTHDSGTTIIKNKSEKLSTDKIKLKLKKRLKRNYYYVHREWPYKYVKPRIICEKLLTEENGRPAKDFKIFCFNGEPKIIQVDIDRFGNHRQNFYDIDWNFLDVEIHSPNDKSFKIPKPDNLNEMLEISRKLSKGFPHVRVDLYNIENKIFFGELTLYHMNGMAHFRTKELEYKMGEWIELPFLQDGIS